MTPRDQVSADMKALEVLFAAMVRVAGGVEWMASAMDKEPSYASKISEGMYGRNGKQAQVRWLAPLLTDEKAAEMLLAWLSERLGYEPPLKQRTVTPEQIAAAAVKVLAEMGPMVDPMKVAIAKELGVKPEDVKF